MKHLAWLSLVLLLLSGCAGVSFQTNFPPETRTASGLVSIVQLTAVSDGNGTLINVTVVTLTTAGAAQNLTFCGTQNTLFPVNSVVQTQFQPGTSCATIVSVSIVSGG